MALIPRTEQTHLAWRQGNTAHMMGNPSSSNPYHPVLASESFRAWDRGFHGDPFDSRGGFTTDGIEHVDVEHEEVMV